jgi:hypothetical protein
MPFVARAVDAERIALDVDRVVLCECSRERETRRRLRGKLGHQRTERDEEKESEQPRSARSG